MNKCTMCGIEMQWMDDHSPEMCEDCRADFDSLDLEDQLEELLQ